MEQLQTNAAVRFMGTGTLEQGCGLWAGVNDENKLYLKAYNARNPYRDGFILFSYDGALIRYATQACESIMPELRSLADRENAQLRSFQRLGDHSNKQVLFWKWNNPIIGERLPRTETNEIPEDVYSMANESLFETWNRVHRSNLVWGTSPFGQGENTTVPSASEFTRETIMAFREAMEEIPNGAAEPTEPDYPSDIPF